MIYITGDCHGNFTKIFNFCENYKTTLDDIFVILGDVGINYFGYNNEIDITNKEELSKLPITFFLIHGNHENRPQNIKSYKTKEWNEGTVLFEEKYPNLLFPKDGDIFNLNNYKTLVIGGAYSIDKFYRLLNGYNWFEDEQPSDEIKQYTENNLKNHNNTIDLVFSHTCPYKYMPTEAFIDGVDQSYIDNSTEIWLDSIEKNLDYKQWLCGHYHIYKNIDKLKFLFEEIIGLK